VCLIGRAPSCTTRAGEKEREEREVQQRKGGKDGGVSSMSSPPCPAESKGDGAFHRTVRKYVLPQYVNAVAGSTAGFVVALSLSPLDVIKARLQVQGASKFEHQQVVTTTTPTTSTTTLTTTKVGAKSTTTTIESTTSDAAGRVLHGSMEHHHKYRGTLGSMGTILREEGIKGLYRGLGPQLFGFVPNWAIYFTVYKDAKRKLEEWLPSPHTRDGEGRRREGYAWWSVGMHRSVTEMGAASTGGIVSSILMNPIWVVRTRLQTQALSMAQAKLRGEKNVKPPYRSALHCMRVILEREGVEGFFKGLVPSLFGVTHVIIQFPLYEEMKRIMSEREGASVNELSSYGLLTASAVSKVVASTATYPIEVIRSRLQVQDGVIGGKYKGILDCLTTTLREEGLAGLYGGLGTNLLRAIPSCVITFVTYELTARWLRKELGEEE